MMLWMPSANDLCSISTDLNVATTFGIAAMNVNLGKNDN
jgi:hypothetical protein